MAAIDDGVQKLQAINFGIGQLVKSFSTAFPTKWSIGTFICANAASTTVPDANVTATSFISLQASNAAAGTLQAGATHLYISARSSGVSFTVTTANAGSAAGTETFLYHIVSN